LQQLGIIFKGLQKYAKPKPWETETVSQEGSSYIIYDDAITITKSGCTRCKQTNTINAVKIQNPSVADDEIFIPNRLTA